MHEASANKYEPMTVMDMRKGSKPNTCPRSAPNMTYRKNMIDSE
jgi:hypothetical protein